MGFLLFAGDTYYACGGGHDFVGSFESLEDAIEAGENLKGRDWWHVFDVEIGKVVKADGYVQC